jgi:prepilin-type N-terminal cleavage/methylation domain-containing protein
MPTFPETQDFPGKKPFVMSRSKIEFLLEAHNCFSVRRYAHMPDKMRMSGSCKTSAMGRAGKKIYNRGFHSNTAQNECNMISHNENPTTAHKFERNWIENRLGPGRKVGRHMTRSRSTANTRSGCKQCRGFTLVEIMVVLTVVGLLVTMGVPSFNRTLENSRADIAVTNLRAIWAAERVYWLENHKFTTLAVLQSSKLLDPSIASSTTGPYNYSISVAADNASFTAQAERAGNGSNSCSGAFQLTGSTSNSSTDGIVTGSVSSGGKTITPSSMY